MGFILLFIAAAVGIWWAGRKSTACGVTCGALFVLGIFIIFVTGSTWILTFG